MKLPRTIRLTFILWIILAATPAFAQSPILDSINRTGVGNSDLEQLRIANQAAHNHANAAAKRADLLAKHVNVLRSQNENLVADIEQLRAQLKVLRLEVDQAKIDCSQLSQCLSEGTTSIAGKHASEIVDALTKRLSTISSVLWADGCKVIGYAAVPDPGMPPTP